MCALTQIAAIANRLPDHTGLLAEAVVTGSMPDRATIELRCPIQDPGDNHILVARFRMGWSHSKRRWEAVKSPANVYTGELAALLETVLDMYYDELAS